jgi:hypothetical protein
MAKESETFPTWLIYHPRRKIACLLGNIVYHDNFSGNQDPYIWNEPFLHSFCHLTQISKVEGQINFWVSRDRNDIYPYFTKLFCDLVFVVKSIPPWGSPNSISRLDPIVDSDLAFKHHYNWVNPPKNQHHFKGTKRSKTRYTLKADNLRSFQPQDEKGNLIDIIPFLRANGVQVKTLQQNMSLTSNGKKAVPSRPFPLDKDIGYKLYDYLNSASIKLTGTYLKDKHPKP